MLKNYLKMAIRNLVRYKTLSLINILGLTIGMAACILILLWILDELSYDQYHEKAGQIFRIVKMDAENPSGGLARVGAPWAPALKNDYPEVLDFVRFRFLGRTLIRRGNRQFFEGAGLFADSSLFNVFSFQLVKGDPKTALTQPNSIVLTEDLAYKYFGNEDPLGQTLLIDDAEEYQVTGVMQNVPRNSHFHFDFLVSFVTHKAWYVTEWQMNNYHVYLLLSRQTRPEEFKKKFPAFLARHMQPEEVDSYDVRLQPLTSIHLHSHLFREFEANGDINLVYIFSAVAFLILLIACANFINLTTARSANRAKEIGIRKVIGSRRPQLIRQFLGESILTSAIASAMAIGVVELLLPFFNDLTDKQLGLDFGRNIVVSLSWIAMPLVVGLMAGMYPAFYLSRLKPIRAIRGVGSSPGGRSPVLRRTFVIFQFIISIALIIGTEVVYKQLNFVQNKKLGFEKEQVLVVNMSNSVVQAKYEAVKSELLKSPEIVNVSATSNLLGGGDWGMPFYFDGENGEEELHARALIVDADFFPTMQMEMAMGRAFSKDLSTDISHSYILNETAVRQLGWKDPVGKILKRSTERNPDGTWKKESGRVIGVVKDFHFHSLHETIEPLVLFMMPDWFSYLSIRIQPHEMRKAVAAIEKTWRAFEPRRPFDSFFLNERFDQMYRSEQRFSQIFGVFSILAICIACLGLFGLASFSTEQRTKEIGIRKTLGAGVSHIVFLISKDFSKWVLVANLIAWPVAYFAMNRWLQNFAYRINLELNAFLLAGLLALAVALMTVCTLALKAALANPVEALRYE